MHIFLQGPKGIGKTTIITEVLKQIKMELDISIGGFITYSGLFDDRDIYIDSIAEHKTYNPSNKVAHRDLFRATVIPDSFNTIGTSLIQTNNENHLICMDEIGFLERDETLFQSAIFNCLDQHTPILGVIKEKHCQWHKLITTHPLVHIIQVNESNRNALIPLIVEKLLFTLKVNNKVSNKS